MADHADLAAAQSAGYIGPQLSEAPRERREDSETARLGGYAGVAQLVEHQLPKLRVASSSLVARS